MKRISLLLCAIASLAAAAKATAAPILVYSFSLSSTRTTYFYNPIVPLSYALQKPVSTQFVLRDVGSQTNTEIDTLVSGKTKLYRINFQTDAAETAKDWSKVSVASYADRVKLLTYPAGSLIKTPPVHIEIIRRYTEDTSAFVSFIAGNIGTVKLVKANTSVKAPVSLTGNSHYWGTEFIDPTFTNLFPGQRIQVTPETAVYKLSQPYSEAVNVADPTDTSTPASLVPGTLAYASYRMEVILRKAGYR
jgi:hypothetical protein